MKSCKSMKKTYWIVQNGDRFVVYANKPSQLKHTGFYVAKKKDDYLCTLPSNFLPEITELNTMVKMTIDFEIQSKG